MLGCRPVTVRVRLFAVVAGSLAVTGVARAAPGNGVPPAVPVVKPQPTRYRQTIEVAGSVEAMRAATLATETSGVVSQVLFRSGQPVAAGAVLLRLDDAVERAQVRLDLAKRDNAAHTLARDYRLRAIAGVSVAQVETDRAALAEADAQLALDQAHENQRTVRAPFAGKLGIRKVSSGDFLAAGAPVVTLTQAAPLRVLFSVPETELAGIAPGEAFTIALPGAITIRGSITALGPALNTNTRARTLQGRIAAGAIPGSFGVVTLAIGHAVSALGVPVTAVNHGPVGSYVYQVKADHRVYAVYVKQLATRGPLAIVAATTLGTARPVVALGGFKLTNGERIDPVGPPPPETAHRTLKAAGT